MVAALGRLKTTAVTSFCFALVSAQLVITPLTQLLGQTPNINPLQIRLTYILLPFQSVSSTVVHS